MQYRIRQLSITLIIFITIYYETVNSQDVKRVVAGNYIDSLRLSSVNFDHILDTYIWTGLLQKQINSEILDANFWQSVRSRFIKTSLPAIQDEYNGFISLKSQLSDEWKIEFRNLSNILSDNRAIGLGRMAQHQLLTGFRYNRLNIINFGLLGGYELNSQEDEKDKGFIYSAGLDVDSLRVEDFDIGFNSLWNKSILGRRSPHSGQFNISLSRNFGSGVNNSILVSYSTQRREFYTSLATSRQAVFGVKHNVFRRNADLLDVMNKLVYKSDEFIFSVSLGATNQLINRRYRYRDSLFILDSKIQELQFYSSASIQISILNWLRTDLRMMFTEKDERHSVIENIENSSSFELQRINEQRKSANRLENTAQRTGVSIEVTADITDKNKIKLYTSANILRYDTPDITNTDDRDELLMTYGLEVSHRFSEYLKATFYMDATLFHLVYLNKEQSANNNWNRVIRFSPIVEYQPTKWFRTVARAEVLANYTVSDFEKQMASVKSFSFRQALWSDSTVVLLTKRIQFNFFGSLRIFERGILKWKEFAERPESYYIEKTIWPELVWTSDIGLKVGIGYRYFGQDRYRYQNGKRKFNQGIEAMGPTGSIVWNGPKYEKLSMAGWLENQKNNGFRTKIISNLSIQVEFVL